MTDQDEQQAPTLEQLASQFEPAQSQPEKKVTSQEPPKFESSEEGLAWLAKQHSETVAQLQSVSEKLGEREQKEYVDSQMQALETAIKTIGKEVELDPLFIEGALHTTYNRDKNFQKIFDNRDQNPAAYEKALMIVAEQLKAKSAVKHDPQIAEGKRALEQLQKSARTGASNDAMDEAAAMSASDFDRYWERLKSG